MTVSDTLADFFAATNYPREKILPIYYGYDSELFPFRGARAHSKTGSPVIVMHGSLDHHHLRETALGALEVVARELPEAIFRFVGHETATLKWFRDAAKARAPRIECTGFVPYNQVASHLAAADLGIVPYEESSGTHCAFVAKIVEYLGVGLPVVSTRLNSASRYFAGEPMITFTDFNGEAFGRAIIDRLRASPRLDLAQAASERVRRELDWRVISRRAIDFVERIAHE
jgi:glycosyltransferase involved in cell wall biosynthesis